jgi:hypothetical protein
LSWRSPSRGAIRKYVSHVDLLDSIGFSFKTNRRIVAAFGALATGWSGR